MAPTYYDVLGLRADASHDAVRRAYIDQARRSHPDRLVDAAPDVRRRAEVRMREVNEAWRVLSDPVARRRYDATLRFVVDEPAETDEPTGGRVDATVHIIRGLPWLILLAVLLLIFVMSAYAGGPSDGGSITGP